MDKQAETSAGKSKIWKLGVLLGLLVIVASIIIFVQSQQEDDPSKWLPGEQSYQYSDPLSFKYSENNLWGKVDKEMYLPLNHPEYIGVNIANRIIRDRDKVYLVQAEQGNYVYPDFLMAVHHVINTEIDSKPVMITNCDLAGSCALYSRKLNDQVLSFGISGQLYEGNIVLYDQETDSRWLQMKGEGISGPLAHNRLTQTQSPSSTTWEKVKNLENLKVLKPVRKLEYYRSIHNRILKDQFGLQTVLPNGQPDPRLDPYDLGIGISVHGESLFVPVSVAYSCRMIQMEVGGWSLVVVRDEKDIIGIYRRFFGGQRLSFKLHDYGKKLIETKTQSIWDFNGRCIEGSLKGERLDSPRYSQAYWYSWSKIHPKSKIQDC